MNSHTFSPFALRPRTGYRFSSFNFIIIFPPSSFYSFGYQSVIQQPPPSTYLRWRFCISAFLSRGIRPSFFHLIIIPSLPPLCEFLRSSSVRDLFTPVILWCARALKASPRPIEFLACFPAKPLSARVFTLRHLNSVTCCSSLFTRHFSLSRLARRIRR